MTTNRGGARRFTLIELLVVIATWLIPFPGRHNRGDNAGFPDGHVKWFTGMSLVNRMAPVWQKQPPPVPHP